MAKIRGKSHWDKVDALAKADGLTLSEARAKYDAEHRLRMTRRGEDEGHHSL